ncbi:hypothetical protein BTS2_1173 [Bacillus sp. TS-2]|nr:hypothetical protein BTS2_1173 [Bacillus sp. TS-2]
MEVVLWLLLTCIIFWGAFYLYKKTKSNLLLPVFVTSAVVVVLLIIFNVSYESYFQGAQYIDQFLGPAIVALSFPLYVHRRKLVKHFLMIAGWLLFAAVATMTLGTVFFYANGYELELLVSLLLKNTTAPIAIELSNIYGGMPSFSAVMVTFAGMSGAILGPYLFKWSKIEHPLAKGISMGAISHAIGTARVMDEDEEAGAISTVSFLIMAIMTTALMPLFVFWYQ